MSLVWTLLGLRVALDVVSIAAMMVTLIAWRSTRRLRLRLAALYAIARTASVSLDYPPESSAAAFARDKLRARLEDLEELEGAEVRR